MTKRGLLIAGALILGASLTSTSAFTQNAAATKKEEATVGGAMLKRTFGAKMPSRSVGARTAACKLDCTAGNLHGNYRVYGASDPQLKSPEAQKLFAECVRLCLDPLPGIYVQKSIIESGGSWFGKTKSDCLGCHAVGNPKRNWPGINTIPENIKRDSATR